MFVIEGRKLFEEVLRDARPAINEVYVTEEFLGDTAQKEMLADVSYEIVTENVMKAMAETMEPQGILATVRIPEYDKEALLSKENGVWVHNQQLPHEAKILQLLQPYRQQPYHSR